MKDIPMFTTEYGTASLILKEVPYRQEAYIHIQDVQPEGFEEHMKECVSFCRMAGAEKIYAKGHEALERYPLHTAVYEMRGASQWDPEQVACLFPVTEETVGRWRDGGLILRLVELVDWQKTHTIQGAADALHLSKSTAVRLRSRLIYELLRNMEY